MKIDERYMGRIRGFDLLERLSTDSLDALLERSGTVLHYAAGEQIYVQGQEDNFINYLLEGRVERTRNGVFELVIDYEKERRTRPLDAMAQKRHTVHAASPVVILRLTRRELERAYLDATPDDRAGVMEVTEIGLDTTQDWRTRLLSSELFSRLAATKIQAVFERMVEIKATRGQEIIRQGELGGDYYVIQAGSCEVVRHIAAVGKEIHLANLGPGDGFGEEAAISGAPRNASVRMVTDGRLMRIDRNDFIDLVVNPLVRGVSSREANYLHSQGFILVDSRDLEEFRAGSLLNAINIPSHLIRTQSRDLSKQDSYIICDNNPLRAALGAFHLLERGLDASYLEDSVANHIPRKSVREQPESTDTPAGNEAMSNTSDRNGSSTANGTVSSSSPVQSSSEPARRVPREDFTDTITGQELADVIDELYRQRQQIESSESFEVASSKEAAIPIVERVAGDPAADLGPPENLVNDILRDIDLKLNQYIRQSIVKHHQSLTDKLRAHAAQLERVAQEKMKAHSEQIRQHYEQTYAEKERKLREDYDRLTALANRLAQQKAQIQRTRKTLAEMLQTANRVNQAVYRAGNELVQQVDHLAQIEDEGNLH